MASLGNITFACDDPQALAEFWAAALEYNLEEPPPEIIERLTKLGASIVETKTGTTGPVTETWTVMHDPEWNGFCVRSPY